MGVSGDVCSYTWPISNVSLALRKPYTGKKAKRKTASRISDTNLLPCHRDRCRCRGREVEVVLDVLDGVRFYRRANSKNDNYCPTLPAEVKYVMKSEKESMK